MSRRMEHRVLVSRHIDGWLVGWLAVVVWIAGFALSHWGISVGSGLAVSVYWVGAVVSAAHFGLSYHLAYSPGLTAMKARPFALLMAPAILAIVLLGVVVVTMRSGVASTQRVTSALITFVYLTTTWHYIKQVYGVGRIGAAYGGVRLDQWDVRILRYGLYPLWFLGAAQVLIHGASYGLAGFKVGFSVLSYQWLDALRIVALCCAVPVVMIFVRMRMRNRSWPPALLIAPYLATFLWLGLPMNQALTLLLLAPFHALQYLAVGHRAELAIARVGERGVAWWLNIFAGAACGGLLLARWAPQWLDAHIHVGTGGPLLFGAAFFVFLNLHHYLIDASIWRSKGDLVKAMVRKPAAEPAAPVVSAPERVAPAPST